MKFAKHLAETALIEWSSKYLDYKALKQLTTPNPCYSEDAQKAEFLFLFERELEKVDEFFRKRLEEIQRRVALIKQSLESENFNLLVLSAQTANTVKASASVSDLHHSMSSHDCLQGESGVGVLPSVDRDSLILEHIEECRIWQMKLVQYCKMNVDGFRKALKKYDKKHGNRTNVLEAYYNLRVLTAGFALYKKSLGSINSELDNLTEVVLKRFSGGDKECQKGIEALSEIRRIWDDIYKLQVRSILEKDDVDRLIGIAEGLDLGGHSSDKSTLKTATFLKSPSSRLTEKTLLLLEREHALLLKNLLDGICTNRSRQCLMLLLESGLDVPQVEYRMGVSLVYKVLQGQGQGLYPQQEDGDIKKMESIAAEIIESLIGYGATLSWTDLRGRNIVHIAVLLKLTKCLQLLLKQSSTKRLLTQYDNDGCTPLFCAIKNGVVDIVELLLESFQEFDLEPLLVAPSLLGEVLSNDGPRCIDPIILTCKFGHLEVLDLLIKSKMELNARDADGESALYHCAKREQPSLLELLLSSGADPEMTEKYRNWTPLFIAAAEGCVECAKVLIKWKANREAIDSNGWTPLEHAVLRGHKELVSLLRPDTATPKITNPPMISKPSIPNAPLEYGHVYLGEERRLRLGLGHRCGPRAKMPPVELLDRPVMGPLDLQLRVYPSNVSLGGDMTIDLPVRDDFEMSFLLSHGDRLFFSPWDELRFDLLRTEPDASVTIIGRGSIVLRSFVDETGRPGANGSKQFVVPILDKVYLEPIALVSFDILVACPFIHHGVREKRKMMYRKTLATKVIGHRGLGANSGLPHPQIGENTVLSFVMAASLGAEYVEFDVQLTKDKVPVLYHDFIVSETKLDVPVSSMTLKQFMDLRRGRLTGHNKGEPGGGSTMRYSSVDDSVTKLRSERSTSLTGQEEISIGLDLATRRIIESPFSTLKEAFKKVPDGIGFNVEVKYPTYDEFMEAGLQFSFEINEYCDEILKVVFEESRDRPVIFSSFHPDICLLLSLKQPTFPVFFLTESGMSHWPSEPRANSLQQALKFASNANLLGIVSHSTPLVEAPKLIQLVKQNGLLLFTYGPRNNEVDAVKLQTSQGVDAVIVDSVARIRKGLSQL